MQKPKKGKVLFIAGGLLGLVILIGIAGWLAMHMMDLSMGINRITGTENQSEGQQTSSSFAVITKSVPKPPVDTTTIQMPSPFSTSASVPETEIDKPEQQIGTDQTPGEKQPQKPSPFSESNKTEPQPLQAKTEQKDKEATDIDKGVASVIKNQIGVLPDKKYLFEIQVGAFLIKENAVVRIERLRALGYEPYIFSAADQKNRIWYTVRIGKYETFEEANQALSRYARRSDYPAVIVHWNSLMPPRLKKKNN
ncbi:MAG: SPOR domain-containing protein [Deltaproteobacteria bacterium]|nr:SPOR domain-containing protein [Deltaproteobacteria bacterium]MBW2150898.1 SPOR domain-containing protein [Deltaproteobacteria bacterium]